MPLVANACDEVIDAFSFRVVHSLTEVAAQKVGARVFVRNFGLSQERAASR